MGNTPTKDKHEDIYSSYIQKQQDLIYKQQNQINELYKLNIYSQQQMPPNMFFQSDINQPANQQANQQANQPANQQAQLPAVPQVARIAPAPRQKLDPYKILNVSKNFDEKTLKKAYLRAAMKAHPDRGGTPAKFQLVSIAYTLLTKKLKESQNSHSHNDLKQMSREHTQHQSNQPKVNVNMTENFDSDVFNKIYEDNKIPDSFDDGYGSWMEKNTGTETSQKKLFQDGFNKDLFNHTFEKYKHDQQNGSHMVQYKGPENRLSMSNQDSLMILGNGKITNFGGTTDNLSFTDYRQAFTDGSTLIDTSTVDISDRSGSINSIKAQRSNISYTMNSEDEQRFALQKIEEQKAEQNRIQRLQVYDQKHGQAYEKIHSMLLR